MLCVPISGQPFFQVKWMRRCGSPTTGRHCSPKHTENCARSLGERCYRAWQARSGVGERGVQGRIVKSVKYSDPELNYPYLKNLVAGQLYKIGTVGIDDKDIIHATLRVIRIKGQAGSIG